LTQNITAATYKGDVACAWCHSGGLLEDVHGPWSQTLHAHAFEQAINGQSTDHFSQNCIKCHVVGFDANTNSANGGFDDVAAKTGWVFPPTLTDTNFASMPAALRKVSNIQCENCHGPGSEHTDATGDTTVPNWPLLSVSYAAGSCAQCHDSLSHHYKVAEWSNSRHAGPRALLPVQAARPASVAIPLAGSLNRTDWQRDHHQYGLRGDYVCGLS
jgi:hypothetical protein